MTASSDTDLVTTFFSNLNDGDFDAAFAAVRDDVAWWVPGNLPFSGVKTKSEYLVIVEAIRSGFPDGLKFTLSGTTAQDGKVAAEVQSHGQHVNGKTYNNHYHFLFTVEDNQIVSVKEYMDTQHLASLIGS